MPPKRKSTDEVTTPLRRSARSSTASKTEAAPAAPKRKPSTKKKENGSAQNGAATTEVAAGHPAQALDSTENKEDSALAPGQVPASADTAALVGNGGTASAPTDTTPTVTDIAPDVAAEPKAKKVKLSGESAVPHAMGASHGALPTEISGGTAVPPGVGGVGIESDEKNELGAGKTGEAAKVVGGAALDGENAQGEGAHVSIEQA
ncbi:hypothetical protein BZG36_04211 [Bifiguratus adelaidae]|uniref:Uncharacterized protein n=1 Tax=Bifiguratus adelaidae TaxID=1938954 RepID=A0A261XYA0_9FUNG|nr:hypothetical protein BZG36_04211 [Bifiguratus adelaidae]